MGHNTEGQGKTRKKSHGKGTALTKEFVEKRLRHCHQKAGTAGGLAAAQIAAAQMGARYLVPGHAT